jgi:hypothetical protein
VTEDHPTGAERREEIESWAWLVLRLVFAVVGLIVFAYQAFFVKEDRLLLLSIAATCMGPVTVAGLATLITAWRGGARGNGG